MADNREINDEIELDACILGRNRPLERKPLSSHWRVAIGDDFHRAMEFRNPKSQRCSTVLMKSAISLLISTYFSL